MLMGFVYNATINIVFEAIGCFNHFCPRQLVRPSLTEKDIHCES